MTELSIIHKQVKTNGLDISLLTTTLTYRSLTNRFDSLEQVHVPDELGERERDRQILYYSQNNTGRHIRL